MKVENVGAKVVQTVFWEYVTTDPVSGTELGRRQILNYQKVKPNAVVTLRVRHTVPPALMDDPCPAADDLQRQAASQ